MPVEPDVVIFESEHWERLAAARIREEVVEVLQQRGTCSVMLTGGETARALYTAWSRDFTLSELRGAHFYFGDERCVPCYDPEGNYQTAMDSLFREGVSAGFTVHRMEGEAEDRDAASRRYESILPASVDVLLLGVGGDGHIASLFPHHPAILENHRRVVPVTGPNPPRERLTVTPPVIRAARRVFVLARGVAKKNVLVEALRDPDEVTSLPARLVLDATWLLDSPVPSNL